MACNITIDQVRGVSPGPSIIVEGTAQECQQVKVTLICNSPTGERLVQIVDVDAGKWKAFFPDAPTIDCKCNSGYIVNAVCSLPDNPMCSATFPSDDTQLVCEDQDQKCPNVDPSHSLFECDGNNRRVRVTATLTSPNGYTARLINDADHLTTLDSVTALPLSTPKTLVHEGFYLGGTFQKFIVEIIEPGVCGDSIESFTVESCGGDGACCLPDGSCTEMTAEECHQRRGAYQGDGTKCTDVDCHDGGDGEDVECEGVLCKICGSAVWIVGALAAIAAGLTVLTLAWEICVGVAPVWVWVFIVGGAWFLVAVAIAGWWFICSFVPGCECPTDCDLRQIEVIGSAAAFAIALYLRNAGCCTKWQWWIVVVALGVTFLVIFIKWIDKCHPSVCLVLFVLWYTLTVVAAPALAYLLLVPQLSLCYTAIGSAISVAVAAILALATGIACAIE